MSNPPCVSTIRDWHTNRHMFLCHTLHFKILTTARCNFWYSKFFLLFCHYGSLFFNPCVSLPNCSSRMNRTHQVTTAHKIGHISFTFNDNQKKFPRYSFVKSWNWASYSLSNFFRVDSICCPVGRDFWNYPYRFLLLLITRNSTELNWRFMTVRADNSRL